MNNMENKKILVMGIGYSQVDLILAAKELSFEVYACAFDKEGPGKELVDDFKQIDIKDIDAIEEYAKEKEIDFIYSMGLESAIPTITKVSERLGLPSFVSSKTLKLIENKAVWRSSIGDIPGNVSFISGHTVKDFAKWNTYPAIIKPVDSSGQRGVYRINNFEELKDKFSKSIKHSRSGHLIVEQFVEGPEISVNAFVHEGKLKFSVISDRISYEEFPGGIIKEHHIPSKVVDKKAEQTVLDLVKAVVKAIGFKEGHIYFQLKVENGIPKLIEFTPRFDGCHMWHLIYRATGLDLRKAALETLAYGKSEHLEEFKPTDLRTVKTFFISDKPGTIVNKEKYIIPDNTLDLIWYYDNGDEIKKVTGYMEKVGYYIVSED